MARPAIAIALPEDERQYVVDVLREAEFEPVVVGRPEDLAALLASRPDVAVAILDGESDFDESLEYYGLLHEPGRDIPALMIVSPRTMKGVYFSVYPWRMCRSRRVLHPALFARGAPLARRGDAYPPDGRR